MIDINLLGEKQKPKPEITPIETTTPYRAKAERRPGRIFSLKMIFLVVIAIVILLSVRRYREDILQYGKDLVAYVKTLTEEKPEPETVPEAEIITEPEIEQTQPVEQPKPEEQEPEPAAIVAWDYGRSIKHINAYTAMVRSLSQNADYNLISVSRNGIIAEIETVSETQMVEIQNAIKSTFSEYSLEFMTKGMLLRVWGTLKSGTELPEISPSEEYATPEANRNAINSLSKQHKLTIKEQGEAAQTERENVLRLPVWIKLSGKETDILKFLNDIKEKGLSINITKISGQSKNRSEINEASELNFDFEIIM